jgi:hypothetical protein
VSQKYLHIGLLQAINTYSAMVSSNPTKYQNRSMNPSKNIQNLLFHKKDGTAITFNQLKYSARLQRFPVGSCEIWK